MNWLVRFFEWMKTVYSEPNGNGSSTRVHIAILTVFVVGVGVGFCELVFRHVVTIEQFDNFLSSAATFLIGTTGPLYGVNKLADWAKSKNDQDGTPKT